MEMNFNNFTVSQLFRIKEVEIETLPSVDVTSKKVPSRHGTIFQGATIGERQITVSIYVLREYEHQFDEEGIPRSSEFQNYVRSIVHYLQTDEPKPLIFSDEPDRYYMAICTGIDIKRLFQVGEGTITFICNDPYLYATDEKEIVFDNPTGKYIIDNYGTASVYPKLELTCADDATYLGIITPESVVQIGTIGGEDSEGNQTKKYTDSMQTVNNWRYGSQSTMPYDCEFDSSIQVSGTGEAMKPALIKYEEGDAPTGTYKYKGTQMITTLPTENQTKYFDAHLGFYFNSGGEGYLRPEQMGNIHIRLLDINNNEIARVGMSDYHTTTECNEPYWNLGQSNVWKDQPKQPTPTTKRYTKVLESEEELPSDAKLITNFERNRGYQTVTINYNEITVWKGAGKSFGLKCYLRNKIGTEYRIKTLDEEKYGGWIEIYLNSACTSSGWVWNTMVTQNGEEIEDVYVYERKIYPAKNVGKYCDFWGYFKVSRKPYGNGEGDIWDFAIYRLKTENGKNVATKIASKRITDSSGTKYTNAGSIAKIAVGFMSRGTAQPLSSMAFSHLEIVSYPNEPINNEPHLIATAGDIIEVDYSIPMVTLNGENIMHEVDIGSRFEPLQPFMRTELQVNSDGGFNTIVKIRERFL